MKLDLHEGETVHTADASMSLLKGLFPHLISWFVHLRWLARVQF
jgi:hypothetical protein